MAKPGAPEALLRSSGLRVTQPRLAVAAVLERAKNEEAHLTVAEVVVRTREILGRASPQTVYACLDAMTAAGIVSRVELPGSPTRFEINLSDHHHHLVCDRCGAISNVPRIAPDRLPFDDGRGRRIRAADVVYRGLCARCNRQQPGEKALPA